MGLQKDVSITTVLIYHYDYVLFIGMVITFPLGFLQACDKYELKTDKNSHCVDHIFVIFDNRTELLCIYSMVLGLFNVQPSTTLVADIDICLILTECLSVYGAVLLNAPKLYIIVCC